MKERRGAGRVAKLRVSGRTSSNTLGRGGKGVDTSFATQRGMISIWRLRRQTSREEDKIFQISK